MKKIEKTVKVERTDVMFEAVDGTTFFNEDACKDYEKSAICAIKAAMKDLCTYDGSGDIFPGGSCDTHVYVVKPVTDGDLNLVRQLECYYGLKEDPRYESRISKDRKGKYIVILVGYDGDWVEVHTLDAIVDVATGGKLGLTDAESK